MNPVPAGALLRVVLDTNFHVAASISPGGRYASVWQAALNQRYVMLFSPPLAAELAEVLRREFQWHEDKIQRAVRAISKAAENVQPRFSLQVVAADPDDDRVLECAVAGKADLIVSNDHHLRSPRTFRGIAIVTGSDFRRILGI